MSKTILAFGDSNTFGTPPMLDRDSNNSRYEEDIRWPMVMQKYLDPYWQVIEEGLPGRTTSGRSRNGGSYEWADWFKNRFSEPWSN